MRRVFGCAGPDSSGECSAMTPGHVTLTGQHVRIEPLTATHVADLALVAVEPEMWAYL